MTIETRNYAHGTSFTTRSPWGLYVRCRALCPDGKVRACSRIAQTADTFFSIPAAVKVRGKTVSGYVTVSTKSGLSTPSDDDPAYVEFCPVDSSKNADEVFPRRHFILSSDLEFAARYQSSPAKSKLVRFGR